MLRTAYSKTAEALGSAIINQSRQKRATKKKVALTSSEVYISILYINIYITIYIYKES